MADDDMRVVARFDTEEEATSAVRLLTRRGIGALTENRRGGGAEVEEDSATALGAQSETDDLSGIVVLVMLDDMVRACETLGLEAPDSIIEEIDARRRRRYPDWVYVIGIFVVAMVVLPLIAYWVAFKASGG